MVATMFQQLTLSGRTAIQGKASQTAGLAGGLVSASYDRIRAHLAELETSRVSRPGRLAEARSHADDERIKALAAEPWAAIVTCIPTVDLETGEDNGVFSMPTIDGKALFGTRLAFDLLGCCTDESQLAEKLREYYRIIVEPEHMFLVCAAALDTIANHAFPALLDVFEHLAGDYEARVRLADAARNAWAARAADPGDTEDEPSD